MTRHSLDARNLLCPMPVIRTQQRVEQLASGDLLDVRCTDPGALHDIPAWCRVNGHEIVATEQADDEILLTLKVGSR